MDNNKKPSEPAEEERWGIIHYMRSSSAALVAVLDASHSVGCYDCNCSHSDMAEIMSAARAIKFDKMMPVHSLKFSCR